MDREQEAQAVALWIGRHHGVDGPRFVAENLHRHDFTEEQRDQHIQHYAELIEARAAAQIDGQNVRQLEPEPVGRPKSVATKIAEETGLDCPSEAEARPR